MTFPQAFIALLIQLALLLTAISVAALIGLFIRDWRKGKVW